MKRAFITVIGDEKNDIYSCELKPKYKYMIELRDGFWVATEIFSQNEQLINKEKEKR